MLPLHLTGPQDRPLSVLAIGAHPDDIEIGAGGTLLSLAESQPGLRARYVVLTGTPERQQEARNAAKAFLPAADLTIDLHDLPEGRFPAVWGRVKDALEEVAHTCNPTSSSRRRVTTRIRITGPSAEIVPTVFRDRLFLAYEIPKWDGDLGRPAMYFPLPAPWRAAKWSCCTSASRPSGIATGGTTKSSWAWPGCVAWSAGRHTPRRSTARRYCSGRRINRPLSLRLLLHSLRRVTRDHERGEII